MKKNLTRLAALVLAIVIMVGIFGGCASSGSKKEGEVTTSSSAATTKASEAKNPEPVTLKMMMFKTKPNNLDAVLEEFYNRTKDTLNVKLDIEFNPSADHKQKLKLKLASGEELDYTFDAPWMYLTDHASKGLYADLGKYFLNDQYPGLKKYFSKEYLESNKFFGKIYGIPFTNVFVAMEGMILRKDLMKKYGFEKINTEDDLQKFFDAILKNEPGMIPMATEGRFGWFDTFSKLNEMNAANIYSVDSGFYVAISKDNKKVLGAIHHGLYGWWSGDMDEIVKNFPEPFNQASYWQKDILKRREWNKYLEKDVLSQTEPNKLFESGKAAGVIRGMYGSPTIMASLTKIVPNAELAFFPYYKEDREMIKGSRYTDYKVWNFGCIPASSKKIDRTMAFIDWIFQDTKNHDLLEYGIEGKHWVKDGDSAYTIPKGLTAEQQYNFYYYELTGVPDLYRINSNLTDYEKQMHNWAKNSERYKLSTLTGFTFNTDPIKDEKVKVDAIFGKIEPAIMCGSIEDPIKLIQDTYKNAAGVGLEKIRQETINQVQKFLNEKYK